MVAIVVGNSLGLNTSSASVLGQQGIFGTGTIGANKENAYVNAATGNLVLADQDATILYDGGQHVTGYDRYYNSVSGAWSSMASATVQLAGGTLNTVGSTLVYTAADGSQQHFSYDPSQNLYVSTEGGGSNEVISAQANSYMLISKDANTEYYFDPTAGGRITQSRDIVGGNLVGYIYGADGKLDFITSEDHAVLLEYDGNGRLSSILSESNDGSMHGLSTYKYDSLGRLSSVSLDKSPDNWWTDDGDAYTTVYTYDGTSNRISSISQSDGSVTSFTYIQSGGSYKVATVTDPLGRVTAYTYGTNTTSVKDPLGYSTTYTYDTNGQLLSVTTPAVNGQAQTTSYVYDAAGNVSSMTDPRGLKTTFSYDGNGNLVRQQDAAGNVIEYTYGAAWYTGTQVLTKTVYLASANGVPVNPETSRNVYDYSGRLSFSVSADGRVTEYRYDDWWRPTTTIVYNGDLYPTQGLGASTPLDYWTLSNWAAGADKTNVTRTDVTYLGDATNPASSTTYTHIAADGTGIADGSESRTQYLYDYNGRLLQTVSPTGGTTTYAYDFLGRVIYTQNANGDVTLTQYDDAHNSTTVNYANGLTTTSTYDRAGRLISVSDTGAAGQNLGETTYSYDADNRLVMTTDPTGQRHFYLYDEAGRKVADVDGTGALTEYRYNADNQVGQTIHYSTAVNLSLLVNASGVALMPTLAAIRPAATTSDQSTWQYFDNAGRLSVSVDAAGYVTTYGYDGAGHLIRQTRGHTAISTSALTPATDPSTLSLPTGGTGDENTYNLYDPDGLLTGTVDPAGTLTEYQYDVAGRLVAQIAYATPVSATAALLATPGLTVDQIRPASSADDIHTYKLYNARGQVVGSIDGEGYLTEYAYDGSGNLTTQVQYATKGPAYTPGMTLDQARPQASVQDKVQTNTYTRLNQISSSINAEGTKTLYVYDAMGNLTSTVVAAGTNDARGILARYDDQGRLIAQLSGNGAALITGEQTQAQIDAIWQQYSTRYTYDAAGRRTSTVTPEGQTTLYYYDADGRLTYTVNAQGEIEGHIYDNLGQLVETVRYAGRVPAGVLQGGVVDSTFETLLATFGQNPSNSTTTYTYTKDGQVATESDGIGRVISHTYDAFGNEITRTTTSSGAVISAQSFSYNLDNQLVSTIDGTGSTARTTVLTRDAFGRVKSTQDPLSNITSYAYDHNGRTVSTQASGSGSFTTYDAFGNVATQRDAYGNTTTYTYDTANRSVTVTSPDGVAVTTIHNEFGQTVQVTDGNGNVTHYSYDLDGNAVATDTALTHTSAAYDKVGRLIESVDANGIVTAYTYDAANRMLSRTVDPTGIAQTTTYAFDALGNQIQTTDANGVVTTFQYDADGRLLKQVVDPTGLALTTSYTYDAVGNVLQVTDPKGIVTNYVYNPFGQRLSETVDANGLSLTTTYQYDADGHVVAKTDPAGNVTRYVHDARGNLTLTVGPEGDVSENIYDNDNRIIRTVNYARPISLTGLAVVVTDANIRALLQPAPGADPTQFRYYDGDGNLVATVDGTGAVVAYTYDGNGNVIQRTAYADTVSVANLAAGGTFTPPAVDIAHDQRTSTVYDALDRPVYSMDATGAVVAYTYDGNGNVVDRIAYANRVPVGTPATAAAIAAALKPDAWHDSNVRTVYDAAGRPTYSVDGVGAVTQNIYDENGNVVRTIRYATLIAAGASPSSVPASANDRATDYVYDAAGRLVLSVDPTGAATRLVLDADGNVIQSIAYSTLIPASTPRTSAALLAALTPTATDRVTTYVRDNLGRAILTVDPAMGVIQTQYDALGNAIQSTAYSKPLSVPGASLESYTPAQLTLAGLSQYITSSTDDRITRSAYDREGRLVYSVNPGGYVTANTYDGAGRVTQTRTYANYITLTTTPSVSSIAALLVPDNANDQQTFYMYDAAGNVLGTTDSLGKTEFYTYDGAGNKLTFQNKNGAIWHYDYDAAGHLVTESGPPVNLTTTTTNANNGLSMSTSSMVSVVTRYAYDALGNLTARTEAAGRPEEKTTRYVYDAAGRQIQTLFAPVNVYAAGADSLLTNGATGTASRVENQNVTLTSDVLYDAFGDAVAGRDTAGNVSYKTYDKLGNITYEVDSEGYVTAYQYDTFGDQSMLVRYANKTGLAQANTFTSMSAATITAAVNASGIDHGNDRSIITHYDTLGRAIEIIEPTAYAYDSSAAAGAQYFTAAEVTRNQYNAFGQVIAVSKLVNPLTQNWATTTNYYDRRGNLTATVDALGYLTTMTYDSRNNLLSEREYAQAATAWTTASFTLPTVSDSDRVTNYTYDLLDQKTSETRVNVEYSTGSNGTFTRGNLTTRYTYDAVGNQTSVVDAAGNVTYSYYDALGRVTATAEPSHSGTAGGGTVTPLTEYGRDALGNIVETRQYANGVLSATTTGYTASASGSDRITLARFDSRGNQVQTQDAQGNNTYMSYNASGLLAKQWKPVTGNDGVTRSWFQAYQYDRLGQQTHVIDPASTAVLNSGITTSFSSGTISSKGFPAKLTVSGTNSININWSSLINTTGGTVRVQVSYNTLSTLHSDTVETEEPVGDEGGYTTVGTVVTTGSPSIATSRTVDFAAGQVASGANISWSEDHQTIGGVNQVTYIQIWQLDNATGQWVSKWAGSPSQADGTGVSDVSQAQAGFNDTATTYNAFGEVTTKGSNGGAQEYYEYDNAGNVVRTNAGDGVDKVQLYDLAGNQTAVISSDGNTNVRLFSSLDQAASAGAVQRTDTIYDKDNHSLQVVEPARTVYQGGVQVSRDYTGAVIDSSATMTLLHEISDGNGGYIPGTSSDETGKDENGNWTDGSIDIPMWSGTNTIRLSWTSLANLGDGDVRVVVNYQSSAGTNHTLDQTYASSAAQSGVVFSWDGTAENTSDGGVSKVTSMVVYKRDAYGNWQQVANQQGVFGNTGNFIDVAAPVDPSIGIQLQLADASGNWFNAPLIKFGDGYRYDAAGLAFGNYQYRVVQVARDGSTTISGSGTLGLAAPALVPLTANVGFGVVAPNVFTWPSFGSGYTAEFRYKPVGSTTWISLPVAARGMGQDGVDLGPSGVGSYDYELLVTNSATGAPYAHATGQIAKGAAVPDQYVPPVGLPSLPAGYLALGASTTLIWNEPGVYDNGTAVLTYTLPSGAVGTVTMAKTITNPQGESGGGDGEGGVPENASSYTTTFSVSFGQLPAGSTAFTINYYAYGSSVPTNHAQGSIYQGPTSAGYYYTQYYTVSVPVQVWVPPIPAIPPTYDDEGGITEGGEAGVPGYWITVWHDEQRSEQIWVPGVTPAPGMSQSPNSYQPGYTIKGHPATYASSNTSASNPYPISVPSGPGGAAGVQTPIGQNGGYITSRPTVIRTYDRWGNVLSVSDPRSANWVTTYTYNANNQMTSEVRPSATGATGAGPTTRLYYDALGRQVAQRDANGNVNGSVYDAAGDLIEELHADGGVVRYDYNGFGDKITWLDAMGNRTGYTYDNMDRLLTTSHAVVTSYTVNGAFQTVATGTSSLVERDTYDQMGHRLTTTDGAGATTYYRYDMRGNVVGVQQPGIGVEVRSAYDAQGNKIFESDANSNGATWTYDYFGHLIGHKDVGGAQYYYTYNAAWELVDEANTRGQHFTYSYDAAGQVTQIVDQALGQVTEYQYDNAGNKIREKTTQGGVVYQDNYLGYDALGLLRDVTDGGHVHESIDYDADGNRVHVQTTYLDSASNMQGKNLWYGYDSMNRQTTVDAADASLNINAAQGHKLTFDYNGNRTSDTYWDKTISVYGASAGFTTETYTYDGMNRLVSTSRDGLELDHRYYDAASRVVQSGITGNFAADFYSLTGLDNTYQQNQYDGAGRLYDQRTTMLKDSGWAEKSNTTYTSYDNAGNVLQYVVENFDQQHYVNTYTYTMQRFEGYVQASLSGTSTVYQPGTTTYGYDVNGNLTSVVDQKDSTNNQTLVNDVSGKILQRTQNGTTIRSLIVNGELMGSIGPEAGVGDFTPTYRPIDGTNPQAAPGLYTVQAGDTLQSIAQTAYGDSKLWYLVADANGLSSDRDLRVGQSVNIPNRVAGNSNDYKSFKPYDAGKIIGDTQPTLPVPEPESSGGGGGCGGIGLIIVAIVAIVVTIYTAGAAAPAFGAAAGGTAAGGAAAGTAAAGTAAAAGSAAAAGTAAAAAGTAAASASIGASISATMSAGLSVLGGAGGLAGFGAAVVGAAVGSIVSQGVGLALGVQNKFSWSAVGTSAIGEAVSFGLGAAAGAGASGSVAGTASSKAGLIARTALGSSISQGIEVATGLQSKFSWASVAASAAGAAAGSSVHVDTGSQFANSLTSGFISSAVAGVTAGVLSRGKANYVQVAVDAFGNALGNSIAEDVASPSSTPIASSNTQAQDNHGFTQEEVDTVQQSLENTEDLHGVAFAQAETGSTSYMNTDANIDSNDAQYTINDGDAHYITSDGVVHTDTYLSSEGNEYGSTDFHAGDLAVWRGLSLAKVDSLLPSVVPTPDGGNALIGAYQPADLNLGDTIDAPNLGIESALNTDRYTMLTSYAEATRYDASTYEVASGRTGDVYVDPEAVPFGTMLNGMKDFMGSIGGGVVNGFSKIGMGLFHMAAVGESTNIDIAAGMDPTIALNKANAATSGLSDGTVFSHDGDIEEAGNLIGEFLAPGLIGPGLSAAAKLSGTVGLFGGIGRGFSSVQELSYASDIRYQSLIDQGYTGATAKINNVGAAGASDDLVFVYRGTNGVAENDIFAETGHILSDAARRTYVETGSLDEAYAASDATHQKWIDIWGSEDQYAQAHGSFGTELGSAFRQERTFISVTTDPAIAANYSRGGTVFGGYVPRSSLVYQTLPGAGESELLLRNGTNLLKPIQLSR